MHGYVLLYDDRGRVLLQKKTYFQRFSVKRMCFYKQPVCANPGQLSLPGGTVDAATLLGALAQFTEESGVSIDVLEQYRYVCRGSYSAPELHEVSTTESEYFTVHFIHVESVDVVAAAANSILEHVRSVLCAAAATTTTTTAADGAAATATAVEDVLTANQVKYFRSLRESTGFNDDSAESYHAVSFAELLPYLTEEQPFQAEHRAEWVDLVNTHELFSHSKREEKIKRVISSPGDGRDWLVDAAKCFLSTPDATRITREVLTSANIVLENK
jgi:hypothetical protein